MDEQKTEQSVIDNGASLAEMYGWFAVNHYDLVRAMHNRGLSDDMCRELYEELLDAAKNKTYRVIKIL